MGTIARNDKGHFLKGHVANPTGLSTSFKGLAKLIAAKTENGDRLVQYAVDMWDNKNSMCPSARLRFEAFIWLSDRLFGKAPQVIDLHASQGDGLEQIDFASLTPEQRQSVEKAFGAIDMATTTASGPEGAVIDILDTPEKTK